MAGTEKEESPSRTNPTWLEARMYIDHTRGKPSPTFQILDRCPHNTEHALVSSNSTRAADSGRDHLLTASSNLGFR